MLVPAFLDGYRQAIHMQSIYVGLGLEIPLSIALLPILVWRISQVWNELL